MKLFLTNKFLSIAVLLLLATAISCKKKEALTIPSELATFAGKSSGSYSVTNAADDKYEITVGFTTVTSADRQVSFAVSSPTGATSGTHYTLVTSGIVTVPAGQAIAKIIIKGVYAEYTSGRKDTLIFTITDNSDARATGFDNKFTLLMRGPCFEGDVTLSAFAGNWTAIETLGTGAPYGPYATTIPAASIIPLTATTATITVTNIWDNGWGPITFTLDWTDPANRTVIVVPQAAIPGSNAGDLNSAYAGQTVAVRAHAAGGPGTFSACNNTFTLRMQLGVTGVGYFAALYTVNLTR